MSLRKNPGTSRISPTDTERNFIVDKEFAVIERFFWVTGIIFTRSRSLCNCRGFLLICLDAIVSMICIYFTIANFYLAATGSPHAAGHAFINAFSNFSGICVRFVVLIKRRQARKCVDSISKLLSDILILEESRKLTKYLFWSCCAAVVLPLSQMAFGMVIDDPHNGHKKHEILYLFGITTSRQLDARVIRASLIVIRTTNVVMCKSLPLLTVILCTFVFTRLRDINQNFISRLRGSIDTKFSSQLFSDYTIFYGRITKTVEQVERSLSTISFFLYGYILCCIFSVTSYLVTKPPGPRDISSIMYQFVTFLEIVTCFLLLSMRAASVNESAVEVKNIIYTLPSKHFDFNPNLTATLLQLANNFANEVCMTGWGLFVINRSFILTTAGVVVSYGVILVQLGK